MIAGPSGADTMSPAIAGLTRYYDWVYRVMRPHLGDRVLEIGAGFGNLARRIIADGHRYAGVDIDPAIIRGLERDLHGTGAQLFCGETGDPSLRERLAGIGFDTVVSMNILEHLDDPALHIREIRSIIPGGTLVLFVPAMPSLYGTLDRDAGHRCRFTHSALRSLCQEQDLMIKELRYFNLFGIFTWFVTSRILGTRLTSPSMARQIPLYDRLVIPLTSWLDGLFGYLRGQSLICIAKVPHESR